MTTRLLIFLPLLLACSPTAPLEPIPDEAVLEREANKAALNWGRMLNESEGHGGESVSVSVMDSSTSKNRPVSLFPSRAAINHVCPIFGICWQCAGRDSTHTRPPEPPQYYYNTINFGLPGFGAWTD